MTTGPIIVAIDGPSGVGKSTVAAVVAEQLGLPFLETGAMYRALGWQIYRAGVDPQDQDGVEAEAEALVIELAVLAGDGVEVRLDGEALDDRVRLPEVSEITSRTSSYPSVRRRMVALQREFANRYGAVMEGRDIGSKVFPDTPYKFFLTAPLEVRVARRLRQLQGEGEPALSTEYLQKEIAERDARDSQRQESPLRVDESYIVVDTGELDAEEAAAVIVEAVRAATSRSPDDGC